MSIVTEAMLEAQYAVAIGALTIFGIETNTAPLWELVRKSLTPKHLELAGEMVRPMLVLVPPLMRDEMVRAINRKKGQFGIQSKINYENIADNQFFNDGKREGAPVWEVSIVESVSELPLNESLQMKRGIFLESHKQVRALLKDLEAKGLDALSGTRMYLAAVIIALWNGEPLDRETSTVLNPHIVQRDSDALIGYGNWADENCVYFDTTYPDLQAVSLRLRSAVILYKV